MREFYSKNGYVFAKKDKTEIYDNIIYLGINDDIENYIEITIEEAEQIKAEQKEKENYGILQDNK